MSDARRMTEPGNPPTRAPDEPEHWLARPETIRKLKVVGGVFLVAMIVSEFFVYHYKHFGVGGTFGFYIWYALVSSVVVLALAKVVGIFVRRRDTYYERAPEAFPGNGSPGSEGPGGWR